MGISSRPCSCCCASSTTTRSERPMNRCLKRVREMFAANPGVNDVLAQINPRPGRFPNRPATQKLGPAMCNKNSLLLQVKIAIRPISALTHMPPKRIVQTIDQTRCACSGYFLLSSYAYAGPEGSYFELVCSGCNASASRGTLREEQVPWGERPSLSRPEHSHSQYIGRKRRRGILSSSKGAELKEVPQGGQNLKASLPSI